MACRAILTRWVFVSSLGLGLLSSAYVLGQQATTTSKSGEYRKYLPIYPPLPEAPAPIKAQPAPQAPTSSNPHVHAWLDTIAARNRKLTWTQGYRVQVYTGQDRAAAFAAKEALYRHYPQWEVYLTYTPPSFRLVCGDFMTRLEALLAAKTLAQRFPTPLVQPAKVRIGRP
jgi:hypothetical protein